MLNKLQYPQVVFASSIVSELKRIVILKNKTSNIIDIPCGNGETSYELSKLKNVKVEGYDIVENCIKNAKKSYQNDNLVFEQGNIFDILEKKSNIDALCIINSFFLLPNRIELLHLIVNSINESGQIYFIIPNINGVNYLNFKKTNISPNFIELSLIDFENLLKMSGIELIKHQAICYANVYGRRELKLLSRLAPYYLLVMNFFMTRFRIGTPSYYLVICKKTSFQAKK